MKRLRRVGAVALIALLVSACASPEPSEQNLKDSFAEQIAAAGIARNLIRTGDELTFLGPKSVKGKADATWLVRIDSLCSSHRRAGTHSRGDRVLVVRRRRGSPVVGILRGCRGVHEQDGQECYAFWDANTKA
jgi:hypothetical protein